MSATWSRIKYIYHTIKKRNLIMSERVDGNNNTEGSYGPGSNESKTYTPLPVKMCLGILATAAIAMGSKLATVK